MLHGNFSKKGIILSAVSWLDGKVTVNPIGKNGFGYDPLFIPNDSHLTLAQLPAGVKNTLSHRAKAFKTLSQQLNDFLSRLSVI